MTITKTKTDTETACLLDIEERTFTSKGGAETVIMLLKTDKGTFSGFPSTWDASEIDASKLNEGTRLEITYKTYVNQNTGREFKNFLTVKALDCAESLPF